MAAWRLVDLTAVQIPDHVILARLHWDLVGVSLVTIMALSFVELPGGWSYNQVLNIVIN